MSDKSFAITLAQINPTVGDIDGNIALMRQAAASSPCLDLQNFL